MKNVVIINGPNLNLLGNREEKIYGKRNFEDAKKDLDKIAERKIKLSYFQSNHEGEIIDKIHKCIGTIDFIIINPGALTHYSYGIHDAILASNIPVIEVHISNIYKRELWRSKSVISPASLGIIVGFGLDVYKIAVKYIIECIK